MLSFLGLVYTEESYVTFSAPNMGKKVSFSCTFFVKRGDKFEEKNRQKIITSVRDKGSQNGCHHFSFHFLLFLVNTEFKDH